MRLTAVQKALGVSKNHGFEKGLKQWDIFLLTRLVGNLKGSQVDVKDLSANIPVFPVTAISMSDP